MNRTDSDRLERVRGNLAAYERVLDDPAAPFDAPHWAGVLAHNVKELLDMVDRMDAAALVLSEPDADHSSDGGFRYPVNHEPGRRPKPAALVPSGTGWPVP